MVVFPEPVVPTNATHELRATSRVTPLIVASLASGYVKHTSFILRACQSPLRASEGGDPGDCPGWTDVDPADVAPSSHTSVDAHPKSVFSSRTTGW